MLSTNGSLLKNSSFWPSYLSICSMIKSWLSIYTHKSFLSHNHIMHSSFKTFFFSKNRGYHFFLDLVLIWLKLHMYVWPNYWEYPLQICVYFFILQCYCSILPTNVENLNKILEIFVNMWFSILISCKKFINFGWHLWKFHNLGHAGAGAFLTLPVDDSTEPDCENFWNLQCWSLETTR